VACRSARIAATYLVNIFAPWHGSMVRHISMPGADRHDGVETGRRAPPVDGVEIWTGRGPAGLAAYLVDACARTSAPSPCIGAGRSIRIGRG